MEPPSWTALPVAVECQASYSRTDGCTYVRAALDHLDVVAVVPRARAKVVLYLGVTERQNDDLWLLRAVAQDFAGAPDAFEQVATVDSRAAVDDQIGALHDPLWRALAPFVAIALPDAVSVTLSPPAGTEAEGPSSPYGASAWVGGWGSWTRRYQYLSIWPGLSLYRATELDRIGAWMTYEREIERQPDLRVRGQRVPLAYDASSVAGTGYAERNLGSHWAVGTVERAGHDDEDGQYQLTTRAHAGIEYDWFAPDDTRGNRLALAYLVGAQYDRYQQVNVLGEAAALFPTHMLLLQGEVQFDTVGLDCDLLAASEVLRPDRRYVLGAEGGAQVALGDHLDLDLQFGVTQQAIPGPGAVDASDFEQVKRASYAEPLQMWGNANFRVHFDPTNGARNDRFTAGSDLDPTSNL